MDNTPLELFLTALTHKEKEPGIVLGPPSMPTLRNMLHLWCTLHPHAFTMVEAGALLHPDGEMSMYDVQIASGILSLAQCTLRNERVGYQHYNSRCGIVTHKVCWPMTHLQLRLQLYINDHTIPIQESLGLSFGDCAHGHGTLYFPLADKSYQKIFDIYSSIASEMGHHVPLSFPNLEKQT